MRHFRRIATAARDESGFALPIVLMIAAILFFLATAIITMSTYRTSAVTAESKRQRALSIADGGLDAFLYDLKQHTSVYRTYMTTPLTKTLSSGNFSVSVDPASTADSMTVRSVGTLADGTKRTIAAKVRFPTFANYIFGTDAGFSIGSGATFYGDCRSNTSISNQGTVTGVIMGPQAPTGNTGQTAPGYLKTVALDFTQISVDMANMKTDAAANSPTAYYAPSGAKGYEIVLNGVTATIYKVTSVSSGTTYKISATTSLGTVPIPANGVFYFDDNVWVKGNYAAYCTVASSNNVIFADSVTPTNGSTQQQTMGYVANNNVILPESMLPANTTIYGAMLAESGAWEGLQDGMSGNLGNSSVLNIYGAIGSKASPTGTSAMYNTRNFYHQDMLNYNPPPSYPQLHDGSLGVQTWVQN